MATKRNFDDAFAAPQSSKPTAMDKFAVVDRAMAASSPTEVLDVEKLLQDLPDGEFRDWCKAEKYVPESVIELPLKSLKPSPFNPRHFYQADSIRELATAVSERGQQQAIHVSPDYSAPGEFYIHDGGRRVRALRLNKAETARAIVKDIKLGKESYKFGYDLNTNQKTQTLFDDAVQWKYLLAQGQYENQNALAADLNQSVTRVSKVIDVAALVPELIEKMLDHPVKFGLELAYAVSRYHRARGVQATHKLINRIVQEDLSTREVEKLLGRQEGAQLQPAQSGRRKYDKRYDFSFGGVKAGELKTYSDGSLTVTLKGLPPEFRDDLSANLKQFIEEASKRLESQNA
ncbi:ParB/RepB/Spo0J family partition protein [Paraburkholderia domus]|uniref:ParB/RepB/Spo0J family partition protein n=1 Tax=Paraburkholderia domus TaxID=2793075 RepID=UPI001912553F|nr:ParB/RepB/Spo0J family partition protein [Paraburkholderia domus]MBK5065702.1 ParB/RepB/Spo0J family partition protein [Burkholderia sp. R-70199]CAE6961936.1 Nucleoid occlusion protein [Paraburkholderia domus]